MTRLNAANNAQALLVGDITAVATSFYVDDASVFPTAPFMISIDNEIIRVDTVLSNLLSVTRAQEGTTAATHSGDALVENRWTAGMYDDLASKDTILSTVLTGLSTAVNAVITAADTILGALGKLQAQISAHLADTAPHAELANRTITVGTGKNFTTIQAAINSIKKRVEATITINVDAGTYAENITISGFVGSGAIVLNGGTSLATAVNYTFSSINLIYNTIGIYVAGFTANSTTVENFNFTGSTKATCTYCRSVVTTAYSGFYANSSLVFISNCEIDNHYEALSAQYCSTVFSGDWTAGTGNTIGIRCGQASTIGKKGTQPQGTTAEVTEDGGVIR